MAIFDRTQMIAMYQEMLYYRRFEERVNFAYTKQKFAGFCHLHIGQEAVCVGVGSCLRKDDYVITSYRSHTQAINKGIEGRFVMAELFGKSTGCSKGKGGSMHMFSAEHRFMGGHGIVGGQAPIAIGLAFASKYRKEDSITVCYLGDAAMNQGAVFEAMNMAATWALPVLFVIENNRYGMGTDIRRTTSVDHLYKRALAFDMAHALCEGMDVVNVRSTTQPIIDQMRKDHKPFLLEVATYRYKGHSVSDPGLYRTKEEVANYQKLDPIESLAAVLKKDGYATDEDLKSWDDKARADVKEAEAFADASPPAELADAWNHVYAE